ncbi:MAG: hypothetical protein IRZ14_15760 [Chloroflexi bacterium]|nr:hypothetical protein [Chloroflexota bacterium]
MVMWLKGCPRCHGDLFEEAAVTAEAYGRRFVSCLQCGHTLSEEQERRLTCRPQAPAASVLRRLASRLSA